jgi:hypothetical protein
VVLTIVLGLAVDGKVAGSRLPAQDFSGRSGTGSRAGRRRQPSHRADPLRDCQSMTMASTDK